MRKINEDAMASMDAIIQKDQSFCRRLSVCKLLDHGKSGAEPTAIYATRRISVEPLSLLEDKCE